MRFRSRRNVVRIALCAGVTLAACALVAAPAEAAISKNEKVRLRSIALASAKRLGDQHPTRVEAVRTTYSTYRKRLNGPPPRGNVTNIYAVQQHGHFKLGPRSFTWEVVIVNAKTNKLAFAILSDRAVRLAALGHVVKL
jgi:hypothetical protein